MITERDERHGADRHEAVRADDVVLLDAAAAEQEQAGAGQCRTARGLEEVSQRRVDQADREGCDQGIEETQAAFERADTGGQEIVPELGEVDEERAVAVAAVVVMRPEGVPTVADAREIVGLVPAELRRGRGQHEEGRDEDEDQRNESGQQRLGPRRLPRQTNAGFG